jgi:hypothetical protein
MDTVAVDGVSLVIFPCPSIHGRWSVHAMGRDFGLLISVLDTIISGKSASAVEHLQARQSLKLGMIYVAFENEKRSLDSDDILRWSSFGGSEETNDFYCIGAAGTDMPEFVIPGGPFLQIVSLLLERSGLDPSRTPEGLPELDPNAEYARLPYPEAPPPSLPPINKDKHLLTDVNGRVMQLARLQVRDPSAAHTMRVALLEEMKERGFFRTDLITSNDASRMHKIELSLFLSNIEELRAYYQSAYRKHVLGMSTVPNAIGGPLSYQFIDQTRSWKFHDDHPHEIFARLEAQMLKLSNLEGDFGKRRVEDGTFKATFHWEREDGIHASLTRVDIESW